MLNPDIPVDENNIIDITTKAYLKLNAYRLNAASHNIMKKSDLLDR